MSQTWENGWKPNFGHDFGPHSSPKKILWFLPLLDVLLHHCMQFQGKLMKQTWENGKKTSFASDFGYFAQIRDANFRHSLDIVVIYRHVQYQKKLMIQSWENLVGDGKTGRRKYGASKRQVVDSKKISRCHKMSTNQFPRYKLK